MKKIGFAQGDGKRWDDLIASIRAEQPDEIYFFGETEWQFEIPVMVVKICQAFNVRIKVVHGAVDDRYYQEFYRLLENGYVNYEDVEFWPTLWIHWTAHCLETQFDYKNFNPDPNQFKYHFISLNNKGHYHRAALVDHLTKYDLLDKGIVTWNKFIFDGNQYQWGYYDNAQRVINDDFYNKQDAFLIPNQYHESFLHIAGEATDNLIFVTEKTILPMLHKKPVISFGGIGINLYLESLGFQLFHELIDYRFDPEADLNRRADMLAQEIQKLTERKETLAELYEIIKPKIDHNYNRVQEIIRDPDTIPRMVKEFIYYCKDNNIPIVQSTAKFLQFMNNCGI